MPATQCGLVILPPAGIAAVLRQAQEQAGPAYAPIYPPHLTLKNLFVPRASIQTVERAVAEVCAAARPFMVSAGRLTIFPAPQGNFIVRRVPQARQLMRLHRQLIDVLVPLTSLADPEKDRQEVNGFVPHITLLQHVPDDEVAAAMAALAETQARHAFRVEQVALICQEPGSPWQETQHFPLGIDGGLAATQEPVSVQTPGTASAGRSPNGGSQP
jgi:2'-5' RNA ligase